MVTLQMWPQAPRLVEGVTQNSTSRLQADADQSRDQNIKRIGLGRGAAN